MIKNGALNKMMTPSKEEATESKAMKTYTRFLESRVKETMEENKRMLAKYSDLRVFAYS